MVLEEIKFDCLIDRCTELQERLLQLPQPLPLPRCTRLRVTRSTWATRQQLTAPCRQRTIRLWRTLILNISWGQLSWCLCVLILSHVFIFKHTFWTQLERFNNLSKPTVQNRFLAKYFKFVFRKLSPSLQFEGHNPLLWGKINYTQLCADCKLPAFSKISKTTEESVQAKLTGTNRVKIIKLVGVQNDFTYNSQHSAKIDYKLYRKFEIQYSVQ